MTIFILALSTAKTTVKANLGPKIFVVNLAVMDLINSLCTFYSFTLTAFPDLLERMIALLARDPNSTTNRDGKGKCLLTGTTITYSIPHIFQLGGIFRKAPFSLETLLWRCLLAL